MMDFTMGFALGILAGFGVGSCVSGWLLGKALLRKRVVAKPDNIEAAHRFWDGR